MKLYKHCRCGKKIAFVHTMCLECYFEEHNAKKLGIARENAKKNYIGKGYWLIAEK